MAELRGIPSAADGNIRGTISAGSMIINDYLIEMTEIPGGLRLTITRGSEVQSMDVIGGDVDEAMIVKIVEDYLAKNPPSIDGSALPTVSGADNGKMLIVQGGEWVVESPADVIEPDNTRPVTSAAVYATVGNIEELLKTI